MLILLPTMAGVTFSALKRLTKESPTPRCLQQRFSRKERTGTNSMERNPKRMDTTLSELIAAAGAVAFEYSDNDKDGYRMARLALIELIKNPSNTADFDKDFYSPADPNQTVH